MNNSKSEEFNALQDVKVTTQGSIYASATTWNDIFPGNDPLLNGISMIGWSKPSKIQGEALPQIVNPDQHDGTYRHLKAQAHHGSGKTGTFALAMLSRCDFKNPNTQAICVCPTRELALQIAGVVDSLGRYLDVKVCRAVPEARSHEEIKLSSSEKRLMTAPIVVGTVGTIQHRLRRRIIPCSDVKMLVLDEADELLRGTSQSKGVKEIKSKLPANVQLILFSATFPKRNETNITNFFGRDISTTEILVRPQELALKNVQHFYLDCRQVAKNAVVTDIYEVANNVGQSIVFTNTKMVTAELAQELTQGGFTVSKLSSDLTPAERDATMQEFRDRKSNVLIATNVIHRGIDVPAVKMVINYDIPYLRIKDLHGVPVSIADAASYKHRIGRCGRFGRKGVGINLISTDQELVDVQHICNQYGVILEELSKNYNSLEETINEKLANAEKTNEP